MPEEMEPIERNIREQYQALGQFVEAFEQMVHEARSASGFLLDPKLERQMLVSTALYHQVMTAKPIFEILRGIIGEILKNNKTREAHKFNEETVSILQGVLATISKEYMDLANIRNNLLHGTWFVGFGGKDDPDCAEFFIHRMSVSKTGVEPMQLPKNADELLKLRIRCGKTSAWIGAIGAGFMHAEEAGPFIKAVFYCDRGKWFRRAPGGDEALL